MLSTNNRWLSIAKQNQITSKGLDDYTSRDMVIISVKGSKIQGYVESTLLEGTWILVEAPNNSMNRKWVDFNAIQTMAKVDDFFREALPKEQEFLVSFRHLIIAYHGGDLTEESDDSLAKRLVRSILQKTSHCATSLQPVITESVQPTTKQRAENMHKEWVSFARENIGKKVTINFIEYASKTEPIDTIDEYDINIGLKGSQMFVGIEPGFWSPYITNITVVDSPLA